MLIPHLVRATLVPVSRLAFRPTFEGLAHLPADGPVIVAANKIDALDEPERLERLRAHLKDLGIPVHPVSAASGEGLPEMLEAVWREVAEGRARDVAAAEPAQDPAKALHDPINE